MDKDPKQIEKQAAESQATSANLGPTGNKENTSDSPILEEVKPIAKESVKIIKDTKPKEENVLSHIESLAYNYFNYFNLENSIFNSTGDIFTIHVQPDFRFVTTTFINEMIRRYAELNIKLTTYASTHTITAYCIILYTAAILIQEIESPTQSTFQTKNWITDSERRRYLSLLKGLPVPTYVEEMISTFTSFNDPFNPKLRFVPSLSSVVFPHDYGRLIPPSLFIQQHNTIASTRTNASPHHTMATYQNILITTVQNRPYRITNLIGGLNGNEGNILTRNWFYNSIEAGFNPVTNRSHTMRTAFCPIPQSPQTYPNEIAVYDYMLGYNPDDLNIMESMLLEIRDLIKANPSLGGRTLVQILSSSSSTSASTHTIEPLQAPTWHYNTTFVIPSENEINPPVIKSIVTAIGEGKLFGTIKKGKQSIQLSDKVKLEQNYSMINLIPNKKPANNFMPIAAEQACQLNQKCFIMQPHDTDILEAKTSIANGLKIENPSIDGVILPLPLTTYELHAQNSQYYVGLVPTSKIHPLILRPQREDNAIPVFTARRKPFTKRSSTGVILQSRAVNFIPAFDPEACEEINGEIPGLNFTDQTEPVNLAPTYYVWPKLAESTLNKRQCLLWSSYRWNPNPKIEQPDICFYSTLRGLYGTRHPVGKIETPERYMKL